MNNDWMRSSAPAVTDVYTNLNGLQNLKAEKNDEAALKKVSEQFESMFISLLLKNMRSANEVFSEGNMFDSNESKFYRDMHDDQLALSLSHGRGFGIADAMYRQLTQQYGAGDVARTREINFDLQPTASVSAKRSEKSDGIDLIDLASQIDVQFTNGNRDRKEVDQLDARKNNRSEIASSPMDFIKKVMQGAEQAASALGVEKEILIAQAALETGWGSKVFAKKNGDSSYNLFNIKADQRWSGNSVAQDTVEFLGGKFSKVASNFRAYESIQDSFSDFSSFIKSSGRYQGAVEDSNSAVDFIRNIHQAGYATDPKYVEKVDSVYQYVKSLLAEGNANEVAQ